jgi:hypothetical protein
MTNFSALERLVAIEDIRRLKAERDRAVDEREWELYKSMHTPDFVSYKPGGEDWVGAQMAADEAAAFLRGVISIHHSGSPVITFQSASEAAGHWTLKDHMFWEEDGESYWWKGYGTYDETYVLLDKRWFFKTRLLNRTWVEHSPGAVFPRPAQNDGKRPHSAENPPSTV